MSLLRFQKTLFLIFKPVSQGSALCHHIFVSRQGLVRHMLRNPEKVSIPPFWMGFCVGWMLHSKFRQFTSMSQLLFSIRPSHVSSVAFHQELKGSKDSLCCLSIQAALSMSTAFQTARDTWELGKDHHSCFISWIFQLSLRLVCQSSQACCAVILPFICHQAQLCFLRVLGAQGFFSAALQTNSATSDHQVVACMAGPTLTELLC